jgi:hypothetical protein
VIGKEAAINEETIVREEVTVKIIEAAVEKSTTSEAWTVKLVKSPTLKTILVRSSSESQGTDGHRRGVSERGGKRNLVPGSSSDID